MLAKGPSLLGRPLCGDWVVYANDYAHGTRGNKAALVVLTHSSVIKRKST